MKIVGNPDCDAALVRSACRDPVALVSVHQHRGPSSRERVPTKRPCEPSLQWRLESLYSVMPSSNFRLLDSRTAAAAEDRFAGRHSGSLARYGKRRVGVSRSCGRWHDSVGRAHEIALRRTSCRGVDVDVRAPGRQRTWRTRLCVVRPAISSDSLSVRPALRPLCQKSRQISNRSVDQDAAPRRTAKEPVVDVVVRVAFTLRCHPQERTNHIRSGHVAVSLNGGGSLRWRLSVVRRE
jgi:hypothetical protein